MATPKAATSLRVLARLLSYPDARLLRHLDELRVGLHQERAVSDVRLTELDALIGALERGDALESQAHYVDVFDAGHATSLHLFEHVHADSRERGPAMIDLAQTYQKAGLELGAGELPDFLPVVLEFVSTQPPRTARAFLAEMAHIFNAIFQALLQRQSPYAAVLGALLELSVGKPRAVSLRPDEGIDASWEEPRVFGGCSSAGQARPNQARPIIFAKQHAAVAPCHGVSP